jgi:hypothetical protein
VENTKTTIISIQRIGIPYVSERSDKLSSTVLRGEGVCKDPALPGPAIFALNVIDSRRGNKRQIRKKFGRLISNSTRCL